MLLSGKAGSEKSHIIKNVRAFIRISSNKCNIRFDSGIVMVTAFTGSAAAQLTILDATRLHKVAQLSSQNPKINDPDWVNAILLIIDEISSCLRQF